ncbi:MAG TPA: hypothetical protein VFO00_08460 [Vitreimonas sp.]|nr:hypothetical protein [Vitreimonas sp.]
MRAALAGALSAALAACAPPQNATLEDVAPALEDLLSSEAPAPFAGTWAEDVAGCAIPQESQGAPYVFTIDRYDQHEAHCSFSNVVAVGENEWRIGAACTVEGDEQRTAFDLSLDGDVLTIDGRQRLVRCP